MEFRKEFHAPLDLLLPEENNFVGVHVRRGDFVSEGRPLSEIPSFVNLMEKEIEEDKTTKFFLSTDNCEIEKDILGYFGEEKIVIYPKRNGYDRASKEYTFDGLIDMLALSKCRRIIGSVGSTFGPTAAAIGGIPIDIA